jgi:hypothetical protein
MSRWKHRLLAFTGVGLLSIAAASCVAATPDAPAADRHVFIASGQVEDLRPGATQPMVVTVRNPNNSPIRVTSVTMHAAAASGACPASSLDLPAWTGSLLVAKRSTATVTVDVGLEAGAPSECSGAIWPLTYSGSAVKA